MPGYMLHLSERAAFRDKLGRCFGYPNWACNLLIKINPLYPVLSLK